MTEQAPEQDPQQHYIAALRNEVANLNDEKVRLRAELSFAQARITQLEGGPE